jgi:hypothetical protein
MPTASWRLQSLSGLVYVYILAALAWLLHTIELQANRSEPTRTAAQQLDTKPRGRKRKRAPVKGLDADSARYGKSRLSLEVKWSGT